MTKRYKHEIITLDNGVTIDSYKIDKAKQMRVLIGAIVSDIVFIGFVASHIRNHT